MYKTILSRLKFVANTEDRVTSSGYQLLYILLTSLDRTLGNTTMNRNECTFLLTAFRRKVLIHYLSTQTTTSVAVVAPSVVGYIISTLSDTKTSEEGNNKKQAKNIYYNFKDLDKANLLTRLCSIYKCLELVDFQPAYLSVCSAVTEPELKAEVATPLLRLWVP